MMTIRRPQPLLTSTKHLTSLLLLGGVFASTVACDHKLMNEEPKLGETLPENLEKAAPVASSGAAGAGPMMGGGGPMMGGGGPMAGGGAPMMGGGGGVSTGGTLKGKILLSDALKDNVPSAGILFIYARRVGQDKGPPLAVLRVPAPTFPLEFSMGPENVMMQGIPFEGDVNLSARLDGDGNAMTRLTGDLTGALAAPVKVGTENLELTLSDVLP